MSPGLTNDPTKGDYDAPFNEDPILRQESLQLQSCFTIHRDLEEPEQTISTSCHAPLQPTSGAETRPMATRSILPEEWPAHVDSAMDWDGTDFEDEKKYIESFSREEQAEIEEALRKFKDIGLDGSEVNQNNFPLPILHGRLRRLATDLHQGKGFFVLRGLNPADYDAEDNALLFLGISSHIADERIKQDYDGNVLVHILEDKIMKALDIKRGAGVSNVRASFHTDQACDIVSLQTLGCAAIGGRTILASVPKLHNEVAKARPDLLSCLASPDWTFKNFDGREPRYHSRPLLYYHDQKVMMNFAQRQLLHRDAQDRNRGVPDPSELQMEALESIHRIAQQHQLSIAMEPGDMLFFNNLGILHAREAFDNGPSNERHLVRLWLRDKRLAWPLPSPLHTVWQRINDKEEVEEKYQVRPVPSLQFRHRYRYS